MFVEGVTIHNSSPLMKRNSVTRFEIFAKIKRNWGMNLKIT